MKVSIKIPSLQKLVKVQSFIFTAVTVVIAILSFLLYVKPTWAKYQTNRKAIAAEKNDIEKLNQKLESLKQFDDQTLKNRFGEVEKAMPEQKQIPGVIAGLTRLSQENNLVLEGLQIRPGKIATQSGQQEINFKVTVSGDLRNIDAFLKRLSEVRRIFGIQKLTSTSSTANNEFVTNLDLSIYTLPSSVQLGEYTEPLPEGMSQKFAFIDELAKTAVYTDLSGGFIPLPASRSGEATNSAVQGAHTVVKTPRPTAQSVPKVSVIPR